MKVLEGHADDARGDGAHEQQPSQARLRLGQAAPCDAAYPRTYEPHDLAPEEYEHGDEGAQVQSHVERLVEVGVVEQEVPVEQPGHKDQMAGARDGQELGETLDDAQDDGLQYGH